MLRYLHTDPQGRLPGETSAPQPAPAGNQMIGMTYPDGSGVRVVRDAQARPVELRVLLANGQTRALLSGTTYYPFGPASRWTFGNGRVLRRSLNDNYQPEAVEDTASGGISEGYGFNEVGNLATLRHAGPLDPPRRSYTYDGMNRLTHVREGASGPLLQAYDYDATGNRTARTDGGTTTPYTYAVGGPGPARHYLNSVGAQTRGYDSVGNTTRIGASSVPVVREFDYDDANRMHAVRHDGVVAMRYLYNAMGERVHRAGSGIAVTTLYDEDGKWIGDYDANGQPIQQAVWLDDLPVGLLVGAGAQQKLYYIEADALGTPRVVIDPVRNVAVWRWNLADEAFGDSAPNQDADGDGTAFVFDMRFPGQRYDSATGLNYNYFRDYDPSTGRYAQSDPIGLDGGMSTYGYVDGSPLVYSDPEGMFAALVLRFAMRYALPQAGLRLGAAHAVKRVTPRLVREQIKRMPKGQKKIPACDSVVKRSGPKGVDPNHHNANVLVRNANGKVIHYERVVSGNMTSTEKALGFPRNTLASHTEARAVTNTSLRRGDTMTITGQRPPCPSCRGYMNRASSESGARISYQWRANGTTHRWTATGGG